MKYCPKLRQFDSYYLLIMPKQMGRITFSGDAELRDNPLRLSNRSFLSICTWD